MYRQIWNGVYKGTRTLRKEHLKQSASGKIVPIKQSERGKKLAREAGFAKRWKIWCQAVKHVHAEMGDGLEWLHQNQEGRNVSGTNPKP
jgi:hypothetical protein